MTRISAILMVGLLMATVAIASNVSGAAAKVDEVQMGQIYNLNNTTSPGVHFYYTHVERGDNISCTVNQTNGTTYDFTVYGDPYLESSNDSLTGSYGTFSGNLSFWIVVATEDEYMFWFRANTGTEINITFGRINHTVIPDDHSQLQAQIDALNGTLSSLNTTMKDLNGTMGSLWAIINATRGNVTTLEGEYAALAERYADILKNLTELQARIDALNIPPAANLTEVYNNLTDLDLTCSYITENVTELGKLENLTNNITNNITVREYNNESTVQLIIGIDANVTDSLNATIDNIENLTGKVNETVAGLEGTGQKLSEVENKTATKSALRKALADTSPLIFDIVMLTLLICILILVMFYISQIKDFQRETNIELNELENIVDHHLKNPPPLEPDLSYCTFKKKEEKVPDVVVPLDLKKSLQKSKEAQDDFDEVMNILFDK